MARPRRRAVLRLDKTSTDPRLCAAIVDRLTFAGQIIETGTASCRLAKARAAKRNGLADRGPAPA